VSFAAITLCVASRRVFIVIVYFVIDSVRKLLDTPSYACYTKFRRNWSGSLGQTDTTQVICDFELFSPKRT
jgi:hypothetical protein